ncbi:MAG: acyl-CoA synthetase FdrA [Rhodanobacteraceae bacterium]
MPIFAAIKPNLYKDSVALMRVAQIVLAQPGVRRATLLMGTPANKDMLEQAGLLRAELGRARPSDVMIVVDAETDQAIDAANAGITGLLDGRPAQSSAGEAEQALPKSIALGKARHTDAAIAQISVPGSYAAAEAMKALKQGLHVFLFSNNVSLEQEFALKQLARSKGLLVMGPDCGTAIIRGVPLGFANVVRKGAIGLVAASGTGLQEVTCQIHALGQGVSQAIGTGGRDVYGEIGGITMGQAIDLLAADAATRVIAIVSKPPSPAVAKAIVERVERVGKPCVVLFLGAEFEEAALPARIVAVTTLYDAAAAAVALAKVGRYDAAPLADDHQRVAAAEARQVAVGQRHVHGLYSGGTFCSEAQLIWRALGLRVLSNVPVDAADALADNACVASHRAIDFGTDEFTVGRPHPMIDMTKRVEQLAREASDASAAVVVLDVVLGYGSHDDPGAALAPAIAAARAAAQKEGRHLAVVSFVCGTEEDPQRLSAQQAKLREVGAIVVAGSTAAARLAGAIAVAAANAAATPDRREAAPSAR